MHFSNRIFAYYGCFDNMYVVLFHLHCACLQFWTKKSVTLFEKCDFMIITEHEVKGKHEK
jgi:hypothetical protein